MVFNSTAFLVFFIIFFQIYWWTNKYTSINIRNVLLILASYLFYGWWDWRFLSLIFISSLTDYIVGIGLQKTTSISRRKILLGISLLVNLGFLGFFKYYNFFIASLNEFLSYFSININTQTLNIILPVGISFYTFQTLSYTIDLYRNKIQPEKNILAFFAFVSFFPQLVAGPIERASNLLGQFKQKKVFDYSEIIAGLRLMLWGMFKKVVIADNFGVMVDQLLLPGTETSGISVMFGAFAFAFQIYADFSGYSDMAIGIARTMGFDLMRNFKTPYFSGSFREFWQRWHISLSTWFRDYLYIPLGGNRVSLRRSQINVLITFLVSGLWHGANFTFLLWGGFHGLLLVLERKVKIRLPRVLSVMLVFIAVVLLWLPFRAESMQHLSEMAVSLFQFSNYHSGRLIEVINEFSIIRFILLIVVFAAFIYTEWLIQQKDFNEWIGQFNKPWRILSYYLIIFIILILGNFSVKPDFIYFQF
ncbi:MAG: MBOAT family protein [Bacteroidales bacterium]|nr:MBOAT family protein [Bacteroidales bacterium]